MKKRTRWLLLPLLLLLLSAAALSLLIRWLESAGGREALAAALEQRIGMPVKIHGDFDLRIYPEPGVAGSELVVGGAGPDGPFVVSGNYAVAVLPGPLLQRRVVVRSVSVSDATVFVDRFVRESVPSTGEAKADGLPEIRQLEILDSRLVLPGQAATVVEVEALTLSGFRAGRAAAFELMVGRFGRARGDFTWDPAENRLELEAGLDLDEPGPVQIGARVQLGSRRGTLELALQHIASGEDFALQSDFGYDDGRLDFRDAQLDLAGQGLSGLACLRGGAEPTADIRLAASSLDLDALLALWPQDGLEGEGDGLPLRLNFLLEVGRLTARGATATDAALRLGDPPDCSR